MLRTCCFCLWYLPCGADEEMTKGRGVGAAASSQPTVVATCTYTPVVHLHSSWSRAMMWCRKCNYIPFLPIEKRERVRVVGVALWLWPPNASVATLPTLPTPPPPSPLSPPHTRRFVSAIPKSYPCSCSMPSLCVWYVRFALATSFAMHCLALALRGFATPAPENS